MHLGLLLLLNLNQKLEIFLIMSSIKSILVLKAYNLKSSFEGIRFSQTLVMAPERVNVSSPKCTGFWLCPSNNSERVE